MALRAAKRLVATAAALREIAALAMSDFEEAILACKSAMVASALARLLFKGPRKKVK